MNVVRPARESDLRTIAQILELSPEAGRWLPEISQTLVVESGVVLGFVSVLAISSEEAEILNLAVHPDHRRLGIAAALLRAIPQPVLHLEVRKSNMAAQDFYRRQGFQPVGTRSRYYTDPLEDAVLLTRRRWPSDTGETVL